ncbi:MAG: AAA family ATPase [Desulfobacterota bacterium]|nr:AAA family ATPase [Thermodesulfobacteriota bacterium]
MKQHDLVAAFPLRLLERLFPSGLAQGMLAVIMARAGVGKTAFLVHLGLDVAMEERNVVHVAIGQTTDHVHAWYDALFEALADAAGIKETEDLRSRIARHRLIQTYPSDVVFTPQRLDHAVALFVRHLNFNPDLIMIDGFDWERLSHIETAAMLGAFKACAHRYGARLWMSVHTHHAMPGIGTSLVPPCDVFNDIIDAVVFLDPRDGQVMIRVLKDGSRELLDDGSHLLLSCDTFTVSTEQPGARLTLPAAGYTLLSGGAPGAEAAFGECAEIWGMQEINFSFEGHQTVRTRGVVKLSNTELAQGHVSDLYIKTKMHRTYPATPLFKKVLQSIWHQVNTSGEVFVVGTILPDATVRGGTGWAAELAKHWRKPLWVFDQEHGSWFTWRNGAWQEEPAPVITRTRFTGTGTRFLNKDGKAAIRDLFERSFGPPPRR